MDLLLHMFCKLIELSFDSGSLLAALSKMLFHFFSSSFERLVELSKTLDFTLLLFPALIFHPALFILRVLELHRQVILLLLQSLYLIVQSLDLRFNLVLLLSNLQGFFLIAQFFISCLDHVPLNLVNFLAMSLPHLVGFLLEVLLYLQKLFGVSLSKPQLCFLLSTQRVLILPLHGSEFFDLIIKSHLLIDLSL